MRLLDVIKHLPHKVFTIQYITIPSLKGWPIKTKEVPSPHEVRMTPLDTNPVFRVLGELSGEYFIVSGEYFNVSGIF